MKEPKIGSKKKSQAAGARGGRVASTEKQVRLLSRPAR